MHGTQNWIVQSIVYIYVLAGSLLIGLRRWSLGELGVNISGFWLVIVFGLALLLGRWLVVAAVDFHLPPRTIGLPEAALNILYYIGMVGLVEEFLFRGLIYRALLIWRSASWALWGSSFGFLLWHIFGQGPVIGFTTLLIGLIFGLLRQRAGSITWLILLHGLWDLETIFLLGTASSADILGSLPEVTSPVLLVLGYALMIAVPLILWLGFSWPPFHRRWK